MDIQNIDLFHKIGESERELSLLRDDLKAANARNEELRAELKEVKAERDQLEFDMELLKRQEDIEHQQSLLRTLIEDLEVANAKIDELRDENQKIESEKDYWMASAVNGDGQRQFAEYELEKLQEENLFLKARLARLESEASYNAQKEPEVEEDDDNPFEYHVPYLIKILYKEEYSPGNMRFEDYDFGHIVVGEEACLRGSITLYFDKDDIFQLNGDDLLGISGQILRGKNTRGYKYAGIDRANKSAIVEYMACKGIGNNLRSCKMTVAVPLTACLNAKEVDRWYYDFKRHEIEMEEQERPPKRGIFKRR